MGILELMALAKKHYLKNCESNHREPSQEAEDAFVSGFLYGYDFGAPADKKIDQLIQQEQVAARRLPIG